MEEFVPEVVFYIFGIPIKNTVISSWMVMAIIIIIVLIIRKYKPSAGEMIVEAIQSIIGSVMPEDVDVSKYIAVLGTLAIFLLLANIFSIFPLFVSPTSNINTTFALAIVVFFAVHFYGIKEKGLLNYFKDLATPIFIFPLEIVSQFSRTISLSIRLFGNILSTDLIVVIVFSLIPFILPLPLAALAMLTGVLQAYIFTVLASLYIASGVEIQEFEEELRQLDKQTSEKEI